MTSSHSAPVPWRNRSRLQHYLFLLALLSFLLGWADGVRHGRTYLHIPETGAWLVRAAILGALGVICLVWARGTKRS